MIAGLSWQTWLLAAAAVIPGLAITFSFYHVQRDRAYETRLFDQEPEALEAAQVRIASNLAKGIKRGKVDPKETDRSEGPEA